MYGSQSGRTSTDNSFKMAKVFFRNVRSSFVRHYCPVPYSKLSISTFNHIASKSYLTNVTFNVNIAINYSQIGFLIDGNVIPDHYLWCMGLLFCKTLLVILF